MFSQLKLILFFMLLSGAAGGLWYVQNLKAENEILTLNNMKLEGAVEQQQALIQQQLEDIETKTAINEQLTKNNAKLTADLNLANEKFNKVNASGDRRDIERKRQTQRARCFEIAQGSPLTEEELNATKKSQINAECTNIANPNYTPY
jgi:uncharacterized protein YxeA